MNNTIKSLLLNSILFFMLNTTSNNFGMEKEKNIIGKCYISTENNTQHHLIEQNGEISEKNPIVLYNHYKEVHFDPYSTLGIQKRYTATLIKQTNKFFIKTTGMYNPSHIWENIQNKLIAIKTITNEQFTTLLHHQQKINAHEVGIIIDEGRRTLYKITHISPDTETFNSTTNTAQSKLTYQDVVGMMKDMRLTNEMRNTPHSAEVIIIDGKTFIKDLLTKEEKEVMLHNEEIIQIEDAIKKGNQFGVEVDDDTKYIITNIKKVPSSINTKQSTTSSPIPRKKNIIKPKNPTQPNFSNIYIPIIITTCAALCIAFAYQYDKLPTAILRMLNNVLSSLCMVKQSKV